MVKVKRWFVHLNTFAKNFLFLIGFSAAVTPIISYGVEVYNARIGVYLAQTELLIKYWPIVIGVSQSSLIRLDHTDYYSVLSDGIKRDAYIMSSPLGQNRQYVFLDDPVLGRIVFAVYFDTIEKTWYYYSFDEQAKHYLYKK
jgi:hypothetical protein